MMHDVIIVGAGPVGCFTASLVARKGFNALILERNPSVGHRVICTGLIGMEAFDRFHLPRQPVINQVHDVTFFSPSGIRFSYRAERPMAFMVDRRQFDRNMADIAMSSGAEVRYNSLVRDIGIRSDGVVVEVESPEGRYDIRARMVVIACGFNPHLTLRLGLRSPWNGCRGPRLNWMEMG